MPFIPLFAGARQFLVTIPQGSTTGTFYLTPHGSVGNRSIAIVTTPALSYSGTPLTYNAQNFVAHALAATSGSYAEAGISSALKSAHHLVGTTGTYADTGSSASASKIPFLVTIAEGDTTGTFYLIPHGPSGNRSIAITTTPALTYPGSPIVYNVAGATQTLVATAGNYQETGRSLNSVYARHMTGGTAIYAFAGISSSFTRRHQLVGLAGSYATSGKASLSSFGRSLICSAGSYIETAGVSDSLANRFEDNATGSYAETGKNSVLNTARSMVGAEGIYAGTGSSATTIHTQVGAFDLLCETSHYAATGTASSPKTTFNLTSLVGDYDETGNNAALNFATHLEGALGRYVETGSLASLGGGIQPNHFLYAQAGTYTEAGMSAGFGIVKSLIYLNDPFSSTATSLLVDPFNTMSV